MSIEELTATLEIKISASVSKTALTLEEFIQVGRLNGMSDAQLYRQIIDDISRDGRLFGAFRNQLRGNMKYGIESMANIGMTQTFSSEGYDVWRWVAVGNNVCPDCAERHGLEGDEDFFNTIGLPKSGFSVCGENCECKFEVKQNTKTPNPIRKKDLN